LEILDDSKINPQAPASANELNRLRVSDLREIAAKLQIKGIAKSTRKADIVETLVRHNAPLSPIPVNFKDLEILEKLKSIRDLPNGRAIWKKTLKDVGKNLKPLCRRIKRITTIHCLGMRMTFSQSIQN